MQIYLARNNQQAGPYSLEEVNNMLAQQQVLLTDLAWHEGMLEWKPLGELTNGQLNYNPWNTASQTPAQKQPIFASLNQRLLAKILDLLLWFPMFALPSLFMDSVSKQKLILLQSKQINPEMQQQFLDLISPHAWQAMAVYVLVMLIIQAILLAKTGQSIGKKIVGIKIVDAYNYQAVPLTRIFLLRTVFFIILNFLTLPIITFIDAIFALGAKKQTLHDKIAKTIVIKQSKNNQ